MKRTITHNCGHVSEVEVVVERRHLRNLVDEVARYYLCDACYWSWRMRHGLHPEVGNGYGTASWLKGEG